MQSEEIDLNNYIVEKKPKTGGPSSLLFYKIEGIDFKPIKESIQNNLLTEEKIKDKTTANGFTGEISSNNKKIRLGFARSGSRKLSFLRDGSVVPFRLQIIPHHVHLQFEKSEESPIELFVQGGNKEFLDTHFLKTLRNIVSEYDGTLNRLNFSQRFLRKGLSLHKENVYYLKVPPTQFKQHLKPILKEKDVTYREETGEIHGKGILDDSNILKKIQQTPELRIIQYKGMTQSPFTTNKTKYSLKAQGEIQFYLSQKEVEKAQSSFKASIALMQTLKSKIEGLKVKKLPKGYLPDKKFSIALLRRTLENERYEQLYDLLLDLDTLDVFNQLENEDKENIFKYFTNFLKKANTEELHKYMDEFAPLIDEIAVKTCKKFQENFHDFTLKKLIHISKMGFILYPCLQAVLSKKQKEIEEISGYQKYFNGFTQQQLAKLVKKGFALENLHKSKEDTQQTLTKQFKKALDLKKRYISQESQKKALRELAINFFNEFDKISAIETVNKDVVLLHLQTGKEMLEAPIRCKISNETVAPAAVSHVAKSMEANNEAKGIIFTLSNFSEASKEKRKGILRDQRKFLYLVGKPTIERMLKNTVFSFASLQYHERKKTTQRPSHHIS